MVSNEETDKFKEQVRAGLKRLDVLQQVDFACLCAMRTLPMLGYRGNFDFWGSRRQKHLYKMWQALDAVLWAFRSKNSVVAQNGGTAVDQDYLNQATLITHDYSDGTYAATAYAVVATIYTAAAATYAFTDGAYADSGDSTIASAYAVDAAIYVADAASASTFTATGIRIDLRPHILQDIADVENYSPLQPVQHTHPDEYGKIWQSFAEALDKEDCGYWKDYFRTLFENGFQPDPETLKRHFSVPIEIRDLGASAVGKHLQSLKK